LKPASTSTVAVKKVKFGEFNPAKPTFSQEETTLKSGLKTSPVAEANAAQDVASMPADNNEDGYETCDSSKSNRPWWLSEDIANQENVAGPPPLPGWTPLDTNVDKWQSMLTKFPEGSASRITNVGPWGQWDSPDFLMYCNSGNATCTMQDFPHLEEPAHETTARRHFIKQISSLKTHVCRYIKAYGQKQVNKRFDRAVGYASAREILR